MNRTFNPVNFLTVTATLLLAQPALAQTSPLLRVTCQFNGAETSQGRVSVDGRVVGNCPRADVTVSPGKHTVRVFHDLQNGEQLLYEDTVQITQMQRITAVLKKSSYEPYYWSEAQSGQQTDITRYLDLFPQGPHRKDLERPLFDSVKKENNTQKWELFRRYYPDSPLSRQAQDQIELQNFWAALKPTPLNIEKPMGFYSFQPQGNSLDLFVYQAFPSGAAYWSGEGKTSLKGQIQEAFNDNYRPSINLITWSPDGKLLAYVHTTSSMNYSNIDNSFHTVKVIRPISNELVTSWSTGKQALWVRHMTFRSDNQWLYIRYGDSQERWIRLSDSRAFDDDSAPVRILYQVWVKSTGNSVAITAKGIRVFNPDTEKFQIVDTARPLTYPLDFTRDSRLFVTNTEDGYVQFWDLTQTRLLNEVEFGKVRNLELMNDGKQVLIVRDARNMEIWDVQPWKQRAVLSFPTDSTWQIGNEQAPLVLINSGDDKFNIYNIDGQIVGRIPTPSKIIRFWWTPDGQSAITSYENHSVARWPVSILSAKTREQLSDLVRQERNPLFQNAYNQAFPGHNSSSSASSTTDQSDTQDFVNSNIQNAGSGKCLDIRGAKPDPGTEAILYQCNEVKNQKFTFTPDLKTAQGQIKTGFNLCLGVVKIGQELLLRQVPCNASRTLFKMQPLKDATFKLVEVLSGQCVSAVQSGSSDYAEQTGIRPCQEDESQQWIDLSRKN